jgi:hypothetical protein
MRKILIICFLLSNFSCGRDLIDLGKITGLIERREWKEAEKLLSSFEPTDRSGIWIKGRLKGEIEFQQGNVAEARLIFEDLIEDGDTRSLVRMCSICLEVGDKKWFLDNRAAIVDNVHRNYQLLGGVVSLSIFSNDPNIFMNVMKKLDDDLVAKDPFVARQALKGYRNFALDEG